MERWENGRGGGVVKKVKIAFWLLLFSIVLITDSAWMPIPEIAYILLKLVSSLLLILISVSILADVKKEKIKNED